MAKHFTCPDCDKRYPILPTLFNRKVRCTDCGTVFMLQRDLTVQVVGSKPATMDPAATDEQGKTGQQLEEMRSLTRTWMESATNRIDKQQSSRGETAARKLAAMRQQLSVSLNAAADAAASQVTDAPIQAAETGPSRPAAFQPVLADGESMTTSNWGPWIVLGVLLIGGAAVWWLLQDSPSQAALRAYGDQVAPDQLSYPQRHRIHLARTWVPQRPDGSEPLVLLNGIEASCEATIAVDGATVGDLLRQRLDQAWPVDALEAFAIGSQAQQVIDGLADSHLDTDGLQSAINAQGLTLLAWSQVEQALQTGQVPPAIATAVMDILLARNADGSPTEACQRLLRGDWPQRWQVTPFTIDDGACLVVRNRRYVVETIACRGQLLRLSGERWPDAWRVLRVDPQPAAIDDLPEW